MYPGYENTLGIHSSLFSDKTAIVKTAAVHYKKVHHFFKKREFEMFVAAAEDGPFTLIAAFYYRAC